MSQAARRSYAADRGVIRMAWDLDRSAAAAASRRAPTAEIHGLMRALTLAVPISAFLWIGCAIFLLKVIR
jgi:hypothetical protein